jgi:hypothetical protein
MAVEIRLLGAVEAAVHGQPVELGGTKQRALLSMLALQANRTVTVDRLIDGLWGESVPATAPKIVQGYVSHLRKVLPDAIATRGRGYELQVGPEAVDALRFEALVTLLRPRAPGGRPDRAQGVSDDLHHRRRVPLGHAPGDVASARLRGRRAPAHARRVGALRARPPVRAHLPGLSIVRACPARVTSGSPSAHCRPGRATRSPTSPASRSARSR